MLLFLFCFTVRIIKFPSFYGEGLSYDCLLIGKVEISIFNQ
jgi:hypothetical protein